MKNIAFALFALACLAVPQAKASDAIVSPVFVQRAVVVQRQAVVVQAAPVVVRQRAVVVQRAPVVVRTGVFRTRVIVR